MQFKGKITEWNDMHGFGFIAPLNGNARVFVHISAFPAGSRRPGTGEFINYSVGQDDRGRVCATSATYVTQQSYSGAVQMYGRRAVLIAGFVSGSFLTTVTLLAVVGRLWWPMAFVYGAMSIATYRAYKHDKQAAQAGEWRTKEWELIILGLIGGWPGGLIAQHRFRHKTRKVSFQLAHWLSVVLNLSGLAWLLAL